MIVTLAQIAEMVVTQFNGIVEKQKDLVEAVTLHFNCSEKTVRKAINDAVNMGLISKEKSGRNTVIRTL